MTSSLPKVSVGPTGLSNTDAKDEAKIQHINFIIHIDFKKMLAPEV
jgi:hypothetical protein